MAQKDTVFADLFEGEMFDQTVGIVDQLATLTSLRYAQTDHKAMVADLLENHLSGVENTLNLHKLVKEQALRDNFDGNPALMQKGYTRQILNARIQLEQGTEADRKRYEDAGFTMQSTPIARDPNDPVQEPIYLFKSTLGTVNDYQAGAISMTQNSQKGTSQLDLQIQIGNEVDAADKADQNNTHLLGKTEQKLRKMYRPRTSANRRSGYNFMIPKFDSDGHMVEMRYMMTEQTKDTVMQQHSEFDAVLASMSSQIVDKGQTPQMNAEVIIALKDLYDREHKMYSAAYVEISPRSKNKRYRDIWQQLPPSTREQIMSVWGSDRMLVSQDVIDLAFGQRKYSIAESFLKDPNDRKKFEKVLIHALTFALGMNNPFVDPPPGMERSDSRKGRAVNRAKMIEDATTQLTKIGKSNIVVRNIGVILGNHSSNMMYLKSKGIPLDKIFTLSREASLSSIRYQ